MTATPPPPPPPPTEADSPENRRAHPRFDIALAAVVNFDEREIPCQARNLSAGGVGLRAHASLPEGGRVSVDLFLTEDGIEDATTPAFSADATVAWVAEIEPSLFEAGLRFSGLDAAAQQLLTHYLARLEPS